MVEPRLRSRSLKRECKRTPGGKPVIHYRRKRAGKAKCASCKSPLNGVPALRPSELRKLPKSKRRPNRPYGGNLCSRCMRNLIKNEVYTDRE